MNRMLGLMGLLVWAGVAWSADPADYASRLAALRTEVDGLHETLDLEREALRSELRAAELRRTELEARIRAEELRLAELERMVERQREVLEAEDVADEVLTPVLLQGLADLEAQVASSLPYRVQARRQAARELADKLTAGTLDPRRGAGRVWQLLEDELRLTRENVLDRQVIDLEGEEVLVDVARLGMVALFYRTDDGRYGRAVRQGEGWRFQALSTEDGVQVEALMEALSKQVRVGFFELPWALSGGTP